MAINVFTVLSEFKFDVAHAVAGSEALQGSVDKLSGAAQGALNSMQSLGMGIISSMSGGQAGLLGLLGNAISASDKFTESQLSFTTIIDSNMEHLTGSIGTLNDKMLVSGKIMNNIAADAAKFGLPAAELLSMSKMLSATLAPKGLAGKDFSTATGMSRNLLKASPMLGVHPMEVQGQLTRAIGDNSGGQASMGDTLFRRLLAESPEAFKESKVGSAKEFNALDMAKRVDVLSKSLAKFTSNVDILNLRASTISGTMQRLKDTFIGPFSILKSIGDVLIPIIVQTLNIALDWLNGKGKDLIKIMARVMSGFMESPKQMIVDLVAISNLGGNFKKSSGFTLFTGMLLHLLKLPFLGFLANVPIVGMMLKGVGALFAGLGKILVFLWPAINILVGAMAEFLIISAVFTAALDGIGRAFTRMKMDSVAWLADNMVYITESMALLGLSVSNFLAPLKDISKGWEELTYFLLSGDWALDMFKDGLKILADGLYNLSGGFTVIYSTFRAMVAGMFDVIFRAAENVSIIFSNLSSGNVLNPMEGTQNIFKGYMAAFDEEFNKTMDRALNPNVGVDGVDKSVEAKTVNNFDVKMTNNFKEVLQPDRIAFTIQSQLEKASRNRTGTNAVGLGAMQSKAI